MGTADSSRDIQLKMNSLPTLSSKRCIYRVPEPLRVVQHEAYTPSVVSIGPYHHKVPKLLAMEIHKLKFLKTFLDRSQGNGNLDIYLRFLKDKETLIREFYADPITNLSPKEFIEMVLIDGAFIIELFRRCYGLEVVEDDFIFGRPNLINHIMLDISMAENQLPFFVIQGLYDRAFRPDLNSSVHALTKIVRVFYHVDMRSITNRICNQDGDCPLHLLDLLRNSYRPSTLPQKEENGNIGDEGPKTILLNNNDSHLGGRREAIRSTGVEGPMGKVLCPSVTHLWEAGIKFQVATGLPNMSPDIRFDEDNAVLTIPEIIISDNTGLQRRNLIAFEQCHYLNQPYISEYQFLMDCLINTSRDVEILVEKGIIKNWLGSVEEICDLLNNLGMQMSINPKEYHYAGLASKLKAHCKKPWNVYKVTLKRTYFRPPWAVLSVIYAVVLLILTIVQVITGVLSLPKAPRP